MELGDKIRVTKDVDGRNITGVTGTIVAKRIYIGSRAPYGVLLDIKPSGKFHELYGAPKECIILDEFFSIDRLKYNYRQRGLWIPKGSCELCYPVIQYDPNQNGDMDDDI